MKALIYEGARRLRYADLPPPTPAAGEELLFVAAVGICGSDMHAFLGHDERRPPPLVLGHEAAATTASGRRVAVNPLVTCGACRPCLAGQDNLCQTRQIISMPPRAGAFAQQLAMPADNLVDVPPAVPLQKAALAEPLACGWHAARLGFEWLRRPPQQCECLVLGGGAIGVAAALALRAQGAEQICIVEPNPLRRQTLQERLPAARALAAAPAKANADLTIDAVGYAATRAAAFAATRAGGAIVHLGLAEATGGVDARRATLAEVAFIGAYTYTKKDFAAAAAALFSGRLGALDWAEERPLAQGAEAFADLLAGKVAAAKIVLLP